MSSDGSSAMDEGEPEGDWRTFLKDQFSKQRSSWDLHLGQTLEPIKVSVADLKNQALDSELNFISYQTGLEERLRKLEHDNSELKKTVVALSNKTLEIDYKVSDQSDRSRQNNLKFTNISVPSRQFQDCKATIISQLRCSIGYEAKSIQKCHPLGGRDLSKITIIAFFSNYQEKQEILSCSKDYRTYFETSTQSKMTDDVSQSTKSNRQILYQYGRDAKLKDFKLRHNKLIHETGTFEVYNGCVVESLGVYQQHLANQKIILPAASLQLAPSTNFNTVANMQNSGSRSGAGTRNQNQNQRRKYNNNKKQTNQTPSTSTAPLMPQGPHSQTFIPLQNHQLMSGSQLSYSGNNNTAGWQPPTQQQQLVQQQQYLQTQQTFNARALTRMPPPTMPPYPGAQAQHQQAASTNFHPYQPTPNAVNDSNKCPINANKTLVPAMKKLRMNDLSTKHSPITSSPIKSTSSGRMEKTSSTQHTNYNNSNNIHFNTRTETMSYVTRSFSQSMSASLTLSSPPLQLSDGEVIHSISRFILEFNSNKNPYASPFEKEFEEARSNNLPSPILNRMLLSEDSD